MTDLAFDLAQLRARHPRRVWLQSQPADCRSWEAGDCDCGFEAALTPSSPRDTGTIEVVAPEAIL